MESRIPAIVEARAVVCVVVLTNIRHWLQRRKIALAEFAEKPIPPAPLRAVEIPSLRGSGRIYHRAEVGDPVNRVAGIVAPNLVSLLRGAILFREVAVLHLPHGPALTVCETAICV